MVGGDMLATIDRVYSILSLFIKGGGSQMSDLLLSVLIGQPEK